MFVFFIMFFLADNPQILCVKIILILERVINYMKFNDDYCLLFLKIIY